MARGDEVGRAPMRSFVRFARRAPLNWVVGLGPTLAVSSSSRVQIISGVIIIDRAHFLIFLSAAIILAVSPGPPMIYVLARSLRGGRTVGLASCFGTAAGRLARVWIPPYCGNDGNARCPVAHWSDSAGAWR